MEPSTDRLPLEPVQVLGGGPFCEIGRPIIALASPERDVIVVAGWPPYPFSSAPNASLPRERRPFRSLVGVYRLSDLTCLHLVRTELRVTALALHPDLPFVTVGTGEYDGGWHYYGDLAMMHLGDGTFTSLLSESRQVQRITWRDEQTLDLRLAVPDDMARDTLGTGTVECTIQRDDWDRPTEGMLHLPYREWPEPDEPPADPRRAARLLDRICRERGVRRTSRQAVWALESLADGRLVASLENTLAECWSPDGERLWESATDGTCPHQLTVLPGGRTALVLRKFMPVFVSRRYHRRPAVLIRLDLTTGAREGRPLATGPEAALMVRCDGLWAIRETTGPLVGDVPGTRVTLRNPAGTLVGVSDLDWFGHVFAIRDAPDLLVLEHEPEPPGTDPGRGQGQGPGWVVAVDGEEVRRLFPLAWSDSVEQFVRGGPGVHLVDRIGSALVHAGQIDSLVARTPAENFVARRAYPTGELQWLFSAGAPVTSIAADVTAGILHTIGYDGELVMLDAADGSVLWREVLRVGGFPIVPVSMVRERPGRLAIGTLDGRILRYDCSGGREPC